jgi:hypothetical protein
VGDEPRGSAARRAEHALSIDTTDVDRDWLSDALPRSDDFLEPPIEAILTLYEYLQEHGVALRIERWA